MSSGWINDRYAIHKYEIHWKQACKQVIFIDLLVFLSSPQFWNDSVFCPHDMERLDGGDRKWITDCRRSFRFNGASFPQVLISLGCLENHRLDLPKPALLMVIKVLIDIFFRFRGDLLFLTNYPEEPVRVGEIVVFKVEGRDIPIVHRVIKLHEK